MPTFNEKARRARTNKRIIGVFAVLFALLVVAGLAAKMSGPPEKTAAPAAPARHYAKAEAREEVFRLLADLDSFKELIGFHQGGFGSKALPQAARWHNEVTALRDNLDKDTELPALLRAAPAELIGMALDYIRSQGQDTDRTRAARSTVLEALKQ